MRIVKLTAVSIGTAAILSISEAAWAMAPSSGSSEGGGSLMAFLPPFILMFLIMYFLVWRPQKRQAETQKQFLANLQKGEEVVTSGGICGKVAGVADNVVTLEIAPNVKIKVLKGHVHKLSTAPAATAAASTPNVVAEK